MAKIDETSIKVEKKKAGKKRKSEDQPIATKNFIMSAECDEPVQPTQKKKVSKKRKQPQEEPAAAPLKRAKPSAEDNDSDYEIREPTHDELLASEKPENTLSIVTVRQKKKNKHKQVVESRKDHMNTKENAKNKEYLSKWKHFKSEWKFEKLRQISIQSAIFDELRIDEESWPIALEYLSGTKGAAKSKITDLAEEAIQKLDDQMEKSGDKSLVNSSRYQRARELLQSFD